MTTTGTRQRAAFKEVGEEKSASPEEIAMELFDNMQHTTIAVEEKQSQVLHPEPEPSRSELPADREKDFLPKMTLQKIPIDYNLYMEVV